MPQEGDDQPETAMQSVQTPQETKTVEGGGGSQRQLPITYAKPTTNSHIP
jgi:hypothetical protein